MTKIIQTDIRKKTYRVKYIEDGICNLYSEYLNGKKWNINLPPCKNKQGVKLKTEK